MTNEINDLEEDIKKINKAYINGSLMLNLNVFLSKYSIDNDVGLSDCVGTLCSYAGRAANAAVLFAPPQDKDKLKQRLITLFESSLNNIPMME